MNVHGDTLTSDGVCQHLMQIFTNVERCHVCDVILTPHSTTTLLALLMSTRYDGHRVPPDTLDNPIPNLSYQSNRFPKQPVRSRFPLPSPTMSLKGQTVLITGASMGIGAAMAQRLAAEDATLILFARSGDKLKAMSDSLKAKHSNLKIFLSVVDVQDHTSLSTAISHIVQQVSHIDVLINNAGLAIGAPSKFPDLQIQDIITMTNTNINGYMFAAYAALNEGKMKERGKGTILNVTSTTGLEVPPFPGEAVYHASKACQEAFTNVLRTELVGTDIKVLALRPGVVATNFHEQRYVVHLFSYMVWISYMPFPCSPTFGPAVGLGTDKEFSVGYDKESYDTFMTGFEPLVAPDVAEAAAFMLSQKDRVSVKALDVVPTAQRSLQVFDREWNSRDKARNEETMKN